MFIQNAQILSLLMEWIDKELKEMPFIPGEVKLDGLEKNMLLN